MDWILKTTRTYWGLLFSKNEPDVKIAADKFIAAVQKARGKHEYISNYEMFLAGVNYQRSLADEIEPP